MADGTEVEEHPPRGVVERVAERIPLAVAVLLGSVGLSGIFEALRFPERRLWMLGFASAFAMLSAGAWGVARRWPRWTIPALVGLVNAVGVGINAYHAIVHSPVVPCVLVLTALLAGAGVLLPWGRRNQALASLGVLLTYPVHLETGSSDPLAWAAGGAYLLMVVAVSTFGSSLFARFLEKDRELTATLSEREARLQSYFDLSLVGTVVVGPDGCCREVNKEFCRMVDVPASSLLGTPWTRLIDPNDVSVATGLLAQALAGAPARMDMCLVGAGSTTIHATVAVRGLPGADGTTDHAMILVHDISERYEIAMERERSLERTEAARVRAEEASRAKDTFFATVSHELRTPLTPILAWANLLQAGGLGTTRTARAVSSIRRNAYVQARLIDDLLDMSRIIAGEWDFDFRPVDLVAITRAAVDVVQPAADAKRIMLVASLAERPIAVRGDADRLQQVVWNLISNGIKFTPHGGRVTVTVKSVGGVAQLVVEDTGEGIPAEFVPHVFEPFRQADASPARRHAGLGLGLAIVRALVERHEGTIRAESPGRRRGTVFTVDLPELAEGLPSDDSSTVRIEPAVRLMDGPRAALRGLKVLVVDDDPDSNAVVKALLVARGADVRTVLSAAEGLAMADQWRPDVVVSDIAMPGDDGIAFLHELRARRKTIGDVPAIALTAYGTPADRRQLLDAGFQAHVAKPFDPVHLAAVVETTAYAGRMS
jgi:PAS domain S-box-containing protein